MGQVNSGQYNTDSVDCRFHCNTCDTYFGSPGDLQQHCIEDNIHKKLSKGKAVERTTERLVCKNNWDFATPPWNSRQAEWVIPEYARPDNIWRCLSCDRFFYSETELNEHVTADNVESNCISGKARPESCFCVVCKRSYLCSLEFHTHHASLHSERPNISIKDRETERVQICCVRCGIYFGSTEKKRKHFRDVEHHNVRENELDSNTDDEEEEAELIVWEEIEGPESLPPLPVSINSAYAPEFSRKRASVYQSTAGPSGSSANGTRPQGGSSSSRAHAEIVDYECPLCLENDEAIAALPCGHIFGAQCIQDALSLDSRCPLCRSHAEEKDIRKIYLTV